MRTAVIYDTAGPGFCEIAEQTTTLYSNINWQSTNPVKISHILYLISGKTRVTYY